MDGGAGDQPAERPFLSIGEVLDLLKGEFPDVTISKIRFLESQGLLDPERTPSGYRKFYEPDVERLRWILRQQREHFLPLRVIRERIASSPDPEVPATVASPAPAAPVEGSPTGEAGSASGASTSSVGDQGRGGHGPLDAGFSSVSMTIDELCSAAGLERGAVEELERFQLLAGRPVAGQVYYDEEALVVARLAAAFGAHGVEARHLRMYKTAAEREASFYEQVVLPLLKQRNPSARRQALVTLGELARLGEGLRAAMLRLALREYTDSG